MNLKLKRIAPLQAGKMLAAFYGLMALVFVPFMMMFMALGSFAAKAQAASGSATPPPMPLMLGMGVGFMLLMPIMYAAMGFIFGALSAFVYNLLARWLGGFEVEFEPSQPPPAVPANPVQP